MLSYRGQTNAPDKLVYLYEMYNNVFSNTDLQGLKTITL